MKRIRLTLLLMILLSHVLPAQTQVVRMVLKDAQGKKVNAKGSIVLDTVIAEWNNDWQKQGLKVASGEHVFQLRLEGFFEQTLQFQLNADTTLQISMNELNLGELTVVSYKRKQAGIQESGRIQVGAELLQSMPSYMGERDLIKTIQLLPGAQTGNEGARGLFIRGGSPDQTLLRFDGIPMFSSAHLYGFLSVFNADMVRKADLHKNYIPPKFTQRMGGVLDVESDAGEKAEAWHGIASFGLVTSRFTGYGPIGKSSFLKVSGRGSFAGLIMKPISTKIFSGHDAKGYSSYYFADLNVSGFTAINERNSLRYSVISTNDFFDVSQGRNSSYQFPDYTEERNYQKLTRLNWMNVGSSMLWTYKLNKGQSALRAVYSEYRLKDEDRIDNNYSANGLKLFQSSSNKKNISAIREISLEENFEYLFNASLELEADLWLAYRSNLIGKRTSTQNNNVDGVKNEVTPSDRIHSFDGSAGLSLLWKPADVLKLRYGLALAVYSAQGKTTIAPLPRFGMELAPLPGLKIWTAAGLQWQAQQQLAASSGEMMMDVWIPSGKAIPVARSWQISGGTSWSITPYWETSLDLYYRGLSNLADYKEGANYKLRNDTWQDQLVTGGKGKAYGMEWYLARVKKRLTGWVKLGINRSFRQFAALSNGNWFPYKYDRLIDAAFVLQFKVNERLSLSLNWLYGSGFRVTLPNSFYASNSVMNSYASHPYDNGQYNFGDIAYYSSKNNYKLPDYHRVDIGVDYRKKTGKLTHLIHASLYNVYSRQNVFLVYTDYGYNSRGDYVAQYKMLSLFPILPSLSYEVEF